MYQPLNDGNLLRPGALVGAPPQTPRGFFAGFRARGAALPLAALAGARRRTGKKKATNRLGELAQIPWWPLSLSTFEPDYTAGQVAVTLTPAGTPKHALKQPPPTLSLSLSSSSSISSPSPSPQLASLGTVAFGSTRLFLPLTAEPYTARHKHLMPRECTELRPNSAKSQFFVPGNNIIWPNSPKWDNGQNFSNLLVTFGQLTAGGFS
ncbi:hypothetical protein R3P38DRAFT_2772391 [Favolaschia claudopus]|uniref:Ribosomal protein L5 n=1 Tax=Favolaschia claudopus TaxID=2862362 RepID=A0AAW0C817_9AGAR